MKIYRKCKEIRMQKINTEKFPPKIKTIEMKCVNCRRVFLVPLKATVLAFSLKKIYEYPKEDIHCPHCNYLNR